MTSCFSLDTIRSQLIRLEDAIIFALLERSQYARNAEAYESASGLKSSFFCEFLRATELKDAYFGRYISEDEHPFASIPEIIGSPRRPESEKGFGPSGISLNSINVNDRILKQYLDDVLVALVGPLSNSTSDGHVGSACECDLAVLRTLSKRIHYGKFVAESKFRADPEIYQALANAGDSEKILSLLTNAQVEAQVLQRVEAKARAFLALKTDRSFEVDPKIIVNLYESFIIPVTKEVQVAYLLLKKTSNIG